MKLLESYKNMLIMIRDSDFEMTVLTETKTYKYNDFEKVITKGSSVWNCPDDLMAKILFMQSKIDKAFVAGIISAEQLVMVIGEVFGEVEVVEKKEVKNERS